MPSRSKAARSHSPPGDTPGPPGVGTAFLVGDYAAATVGTLTFNIFEWRVEMRATTVNTRAHGQYWARPITVERSWTFTGRGYITAGSAAHAPNLGFANDTTAVADIAVVGYSGTIADTVIFQGTGQMVRGTLDCPDGAMAVQDIEIEGYGTPTIGV
jgi:hypothetical protein